MNGKSGGPMATPSVFSVKLSIGYDVGSGQVEDSQDIFFEVMS
jgi:hypothetical protein